MLRRREAWPDRPIEGRGRAGPEDDGMRERRSRGLRQARKTRDAILVLVTLLGELDEIDAREPDATAFDELAGLFDDLRDFAACGASAMRHAGSKDVPERRAQRKRN